MILLDTNVVSAMFRLEQEPDARAWLDRQLPDQLCISSITLYEIQRGIEKLAHGRRRQRLATQLELLLDHMFKDRLLDFDRAAALSTAGYQIKREKAGHPIDMADAMIAGICISQGAALASRNIRHFSGLEVDLINPWSEPA
ncbi:MAG: type II toxin-antitoxin system VapC family toxin [Hyphomicrobiaceae bacterium]|nr:type II toxin-antitoxin system VapC family toxin [Hyphomicrobiaceae bacterium]